MSTAPRLFGTDGIRGPVGEFPLDRGTVEQLGLRLGEALSADHSHPQIVIGGDTRDSTVQLAGWLASGLTTAGVTSRYAGVLPTPGVALLTRRLDLDAGVAISASHNPHPDNGIKLFDRHGFKWSRAAEARLEQALVDPLDAPDPAPIEVDPALDELYYLALVESLPTGQDLSGLRIALDLANGAATPYARRLFEECGAEVEVTGDRPDGTNINHRGGSTHPEEVAELARRHHCDLGIAFDGDADRAILVDDTGTVQDGDTILYLWAEELMRRGHLEPPQIVATTMSNLGLERALQRHGIGTLRCDVGDRAVVEMLRANGLILGGEQSGHIIQMELGTTGDGLATALAMAGIVARSGESLSSLAEPMRRFPQVLVNVPVVEKIPFDQLPETQEAAQRIEEHLGDSGRLLLRYSGTEALARVMIEGEDQREIDLLAHELAETIRSEIQERTSEAT